MTSIDWEVSLKQEDVNLLYEVSTSIHSIHDLDEMLRNVLSKIKDVFRMEGASIALHDSVRKEFYFIRTVEEQMGDASPKMQEMRFPDDYGVAGLVLKKQKPIIIRNVSNDDRFENRLHIQQKLQTRSMICVPLKTRKELIGVLYALNKREGEFSTKDMLLLEILSGSLAISIENARLYGEVREYATSLEKENLRLKTECQSRFNVQGIVGSSAAMRRVFDLVDKVIDTRTTVLIQGDTGTGKELLAKAIHYSGNARNKPFIAENCGGLSENLLESELFGHVKGAFTGAVSDKKGIFELANGGTVFLDEISDMPPTMQIKLLRVLQENIIRPVGGSQYKRVDFRLISSTNRDLLQKVNEGKFRQDLYYRIQVFPIVLPPLRERKEDIPLLASHFLKEFAVGFDRPLARLTPAAIGILMRHDWPGNVRELKNELERAVALAGEGGEITENCFSERIRQSSGCDETTIAPPDTLKEAVERLEQKLVVETLRKTGGNRSQAAKILGITRQGLLNKIVRYKINI